MFVLFFSLNSFCAESYNGSVLKSGISLSEQLPSYFFGTWRVKSVLIETNSPKNFKTKNTDVWNLSKSGDVINLSNPFSGASASVTLDYVGKDAIRFTRKGNYDDKILTDIVELFLSEESFYGSNKIILETLSNVDNKVIKTVTASYKLTGEKIAGMSILGK